MRVGWIGGAREIAYCVGLSLFLASGFPRVALGGVSRLVLVGSEIPRRLSVGSHYIFCRSDTLYLNGRLLQRGVDYSFDTRLGGFDLSPLDVTAVDTLAVSYRKLPAWVQQTYGRPLPDAGGEKTSTVFTMSGGEGRGLFSRRSEVTFSGAKSFRFSARSSGSSDFSQSLDLAISGELSPGLHISGAVSDRGYDPSYGPANSRLEELDKISLKISSDKFVAQVGDIVMAPGFGLGGASDRRIHGASVVAGTSHWHVNALAARPKGRFATSRFHGQDGLQGPYQIGEGGRAQSIVPGSETIWLDGKRLERGAHKDYTIGYPSGQVTFSVNQTIDRRSRIEVDYEPLATDYKGELFAGGGGMSWDDSAFFVAVELVRDGEDRDQPQVGELSAADRDLLAMVGDQASEAVRSGVRDDSAGSYAIAAGSPPDTVYQYVGQGNGQYSITFSYVGAKKGDYRFLGTDRYEYVGVGLGDYSPVVMVPAPERIDACYAEVGLRNPWLGEVIAEFRESRFDRNLLSDLDDGDNDGRIYSIQSRKQWLRHDKANHLTFRIHRKDSEYRERSRLHGPDFGRRFFFPDDYVASSDESLDEVTATVSLLEAVTVRPIFARLAYRGSFRSRTGGVEAEVAPMGGMEATIAWTTIRGYLDTALVTRVADGDNIRGRLGYGIARFLTVSAEYEHDDRYNDYSGEPRGTRYDRWHLELDRKGERLRVEFYVEDTLAGGWAQILERKRVAVGSGRRWGDLTYKLSLAHQWLNQIAGKERSFLGRLSYHYSNPDRKLTLSGAYTISTETRNARGISYLEVEPGLGNYALEDGRYVPDPDGNYIQVEEVHSDRSRVRRGEKSFHVTRDMGLVMVRFDSNVEEELLDEGERNPTWVVPFLSDGDQPYLFYGRRYSADVRMFPVHGFHAVNLAYSEYLQMRRLEGTDQRRMNREGVLSLRQVVTNTHFEEKVEHFETDRDQYYSGGGEIDGFKIGLSVVQMFSSGEVSAGGGFRRAESMAGERSELCVINLGGRFRIAKGGELRSSLELYRQAFSGVSGTPSYYLTESKPGERGALWSIRLNHGVKRGMRVSFTLSGRHADNRSARVTGRGEVVAEF